MKLLRNLKKFLYRKLNNTKIEFYYEDPKVLKLILDEILPLKQKMILLSGKPTYIVYTLNKGETTDMVTTLELFDKSYFILNVVLESRYLNNEFFVDTLFTVEDIDTDDKYFLPYNVVMQGAIKIVGYKYVKTL